MARTDAHAPMDVKISRGELAASPFHRCLRSGEPCDLPPRADAAKGSTRCWWNFVYTGTRVCACRTCSDRDGRRLERRRDRHKARLDARQ